MKRLNTLLALLCGLVLVSTPALARDEKGWFEFKPAASAMASGNPIDLRSLNEKTAGENGVIGVRGGQFIHTKTGTVEPGNIIDPLVHFAGRTNVNFTDEAKPSLLANLKPYIDREHRRVRSTTGELELDYGRGILTINAAKAQAVSGALKEAGATMLRDVSIDSSMELGHIIAVSLDDQPLASAKRILLQVMSEEKASDFRTEPAFNKLLRIINIGHDPWLVCNMEGTVSFRRPDAGQLKVVVLDLAGNATNDTASAAEIRLRHNAMYYLIQAETAR